MLGTLKIDEAVAAFIHLAFVWDLKKHKVLIFTLLFKKITFYKKSYFCWKFSKHFLSRNQVFWFQGWGSDKYLAGLGQVLSQWNFQKWSDMKSSQIKWFSKFSDSVILKIHWFSGSQNSLILILKIPSLQLVLCWWHFQSQFYFVLLYRCNSWLKSGLYISSRFIFVSNLCSLVITVVRYYLYYLNTLSWILKSFVI